MFLNVDVKVIANILEIVMLIMFGLSWPINLVKAYKARTAKGNSLLFYSALELGYISGLTAKIINNGAIYVIIFYCINFTLIMGCIAVYFRNRALDKKAEEEKKNLEVEAD